MLKIFCLVASLIVIAIGEDYEYVYILSTRSQLALDGTNVNITAAIPDLSHGQQWLLKGLSMGTFGLFNRRTGYYLDILDLDCNPSQLVSSSERLEVVLPTQEVYINSDGTIGVPCDQSIVLELNDEKKLTLAHKSDNDNDNKFVIQLVVSDD